MSPTLQNILWYIAIATGGAVLATGLQFGVMLSGPGDIIIRPLAATFVTTLFGTLATVAGAAFRPKAGREDISGLVSAVGPTAAKAALEDEQVRQVTGAAAPLSDEDVDRISRRGLELMREDAVQPVSRSRPWLPGSAPSDPIGPPHER